jgi:hypothetical protein
VKSDGLFACHPLRVTRYASRIYEKVKKELLLATKNKHKLEGYPIYLPLWTGMSGHMMTKNILKFRKQETPLMKIHG